MSSRLGHSGAMLWLALMSLPALAGTAVQQPLRIHTVPIVNQDRFLASILATQIGTAAPEAEITAHHGDAVIRAARDGRADLIITHVDFAGSQQLLQQGLLAAGAVVFANPVALIGPADAPAEVARAETIEQAHAVIRKAGGCLRENALVHLRQFYDAALRCSPSDDGATGLGAVLAALGQGQYVWWGLHPFLMAEGALGGRGQAFVPPDPRVLRPLMAWPVRGADAARAQRVIEALRSAQAQAAVSAFRRPGSPDRQVWWPVTALDRLRAIENRGHAIVAVKNDVARAAGSHRDPAHEAKRAFEVRLAHALAQILPGQPEALEVRILRKDQRLSAVAGGEVDFGISMFRTGNRAQSTVTFSKPYYRDGLAILQQKGHAQPALATARLLALAKDQEDWREDLRRLGRDPNTIITVQSVEEGASRVETGAAEGFVAPRVNLRVWLDAQKEPRALQISPRVVSHEFAVALPRDNPLLKQRVDEEIERLEAAGTLAQWRQEAGL